MTTPYQTAPDGAFVIGGGTWNYGQTMNEDIGRAAFEFPMPNPGNMLDLLRIALERLPIEALQPFADFLGIVDGVFDSIGAAVDAIIGGLIVRPILQTVENFTQWVSDFFDAMGSGLVSGDLEEFGEWFDGNIVQPIFGTIDGFIRGVLGLVGSGFNVNVVEETAISLAESIAAMNSIITKLQQEASSGEFTGTAVSVDFTKYAAGSTMGADWVQGYSGTGTGTLGVGSGRVKWLGSANNRTGVSRYVGKLATSDFQKVGAAFATLPSTNFLGGSESFNYLYGRMNDTSNTYVYARLGKGSLELGCYVSGVKTVFATDNGFKFQPGSAYWLECGTTGGARIFRVWKNNTVILTYTDASVISQLGNMHVGLGATAFSDTYKPAETSVFVFYDNVPAVVQGCGWRVARTSGGVGDIANGTNLFPTSWFNTVDYMSDDLAATYVASQNKIVCPADGWYSVSIYQYGDNNLGLFTGGKNRATLFKNGVAVQHTNPIPSNVNVGYNGFGGTFTVYCEKGDELQPGYTSNWSATDLLEHDSGGLGTYWAGTFIGNKKAV